MNWTRRARVFLAISLMTQLSLYSWSKASNDQEALSMAPANFPFAQDQAWYTEESYLFWKPYAGNMQYGNKDTLTVFDNFNLADRFKVKTPDFEWSSGVRVAIGQYLPNHDLWDHGFTTTFFYTETHDKVHGNVANNVSFNAAFFPGISNPADKGSFDWKLNYWTLDWMVGRQFTMTPKVVFHPYFGLRGSWQYQHGRETFFWFDDDGSGSTQTFLGKSSLDNDFWGVGPRIGTSFIYYFKNSFSFSANIAAALLVGGQHLREDSIRKSIFTDVGTISEAVSNNKSDDSLKVIRSNIEASIGIGWESWLRDHTVRIAPSVSLEGSLWFAMNQLYNIYTSSNLITNIEQRRQGNLGLMGVSFNLQVDF